MKYMILLLAMLCGCQSFDVSNNSGTITINNEKNVGTPDVGVLEQVL